MVTRCIRPLWVVGPISVAHQPGSIIFAVNLLWALLILFAPVRTPYLVINYHPLCCHRCVYPSKLAGLLPHSRLPFRFRLSSFIIGCRFFDGGVKRVCETLMADADVLSPLVARLEVRDRVVSRVH